MLKCTEFMLTNCFGHGVKPDVHTVRDIVATDGHTPATGKRSERSSTYILYANRTIEGVLLRQDFDGVVPRRGEAFETNFCSQPSKYSLRAGRSSVVEELTAIPQVRHHDEHKKLRHGEHQQPTHARPAELTRRNHAAFPRWRLSRIPLRPGAFCEG